MRTSKNLGLFNRFVTLLFHGDWLFLFLFLFLSNAASIASIDESTHWPKKFEERSSCELKSENSWLVAKATVCKWKGFTLKFCMPKNERKKELFFTNQRYAKLFHPRSSTKHKFPRSALKNSLSLILSFHVFRSFPPTLSSFLFLAHCALVTVF